jgi:hypothetical protein
LYAGNDVDVFDFTLPPTPPRELFDVRFERNNYVANYDQEDIVNMQGVTYPVSINFNNPRADYSIVDPISGAIYGKVKAGTNENIIINYSKSNSFKLVTEASDETFFINVNNNPVNSNVAEITFAIDNDATVAISVVNSIGVEVASLDVMSLRKGVHYQTIDITNLPIGSYTVRMVANGESKFFMMSVIR